jgi:hypothetical protein
MEGPVLDLALEVGRQRLTEHFQRLVFGRSGEREIAGVGQHLARGYAPRKCVVHDVFRVGFLVFIFVLNSIAQCLAHCRRGLAALTRVGLINDDCEGLARFV